MNQLKTNTLALPLLLVKKRFLSLRSLRKLVKLFVQGIYSTCCPADPYLGVYKADIDHNLDTVLAGF